MTRSAQNWGKAFAKHERSAPDIRALAAAFDAAYAVEIPLPQAGLLTAVLPLTAAARADIRAGIEALAMAPPAGVERDALAASFEQSLFNRLYHATSKVLALELGVAAERGLLAGGTPQERYAFFCQCLADRAFAAALMAQYPALARRVTLAIALWREAALELLARLARDHAAIREQVFSGEDPGALMAIAALGDSHAGGRTVHRLTFASGKRLIYKPRPAAMEKGVHDLIAWANAKGLSPDLFVPFALDMGSHGWVTHADAGPCRGEAALRRFFRRQGGNLALTYLIGASDLHYENIVAAGEYPVIVDLETLFQPRAGHASKGASGAALDVLNTSVTRTLMLPARISGDDPHGTGARKADISALGFVEGQGAPFAGIAWDGTGTDAMRLAEQYAELPAAASLPRLGERNIPSTEYAEDIASGFDAAYDFFARHRKALPRGNGPLAVFKGKTIRQVFRPTTFYFQLLTESWHPRFAADADALEAHLRTRLRAAGAVEKDREDAEEAEIADLVRGDVPYFRASVGGLHATSLVRPRLRVKLPSQGWKDCLKRTAALCDADKQRQLWITRLSFADFARPLAPTLAKPRAFDRAAAKRLAGRIGDRLCDLAILKGKKASWLFPMIEDGAHLVPSVAGFDLYNGLAGIGLFLARLSLVTGKARHCDMAGAAMAEALALHAANAKHPLSSGAFEGDGGLAYALSLAGVWLKRRDWRDEAVAMLTARQRHVLKAPIGDLGLGHAGFLAVGTAVARIADAPALLRRLRKVARALRDVPADALPGDEDCGLAHGRAGFGLALARWGRATNDREAQARAADWIGADLAAAERTRTNQENSGAAMLGWCRGGIGAALAGLRLGFTVQDAARRLVGDLALKDTRGLALCPCHGTLGMLEFLDAAAAAGIEEAQPLFTRMARETFGRIASGEWVADNAHRQEQPGLLLGLAGTGYALLRMLDPATPSFLMLEG